MANTPRNYYQPRRPTWARKTILALSIAGLFFIGGFSIMHGFNRAGSGAKEDAMAFGRKLVSDGSQLRDVECMDYDSDGDCYVSCTVFIRDQPAQAIECAAHSWGCWRASGCRMQKPALRTR